MIYILPYNPVLFSYKSHTKLYGKIAIDKRVVDMVISDNSFNKVNKISYSFYNVGIQFENNVLPNQYTCTSINLTWNDKVSNQLINKKICCGGITSREYSDTISRIVSTDICFQPADSIHIIKKCYKLINSDFSNTMLMQAYWDHVVLRIIKRRNFDFVLGPLYIGFDNHNYIDLLK